MTFEAEKPIAARPEMSSSIVPDLLVERKFVSTFCKLDNGSFDARDGM